MKTYNLGWGKGVPYQQVPTENGRDSLFNNLKNSFETFYTLTATLNLREKMFKINMLLRCSFLVQNHFNFLHLQSEYR